MPDAAPPSAPSERTTLKRLPDRGRFDREVLHAILDEALICHLGFVHDGAPVVVPTLLGRIDDTLYVHGSVASRAMRTAGRTEQVCVTATLVDGIVVARSGFHSSMNYRSAMVFGHARLVDDADEKVRALDAIVDHVMAGRSADLRPHTDVELRATTVLALPLDEASAKVRTGGPVDDEADLDLDVWAGVLPLRMVAGDAEPDELLRPDIPVPAYLADYVRPTTAG